MAVLYSTGWEAGSAAWYTASTAAWFFNSFSGFTNTATWQHRTTGSGAIGGNWSILPAWGVSCTVGTVPTTARWLHFWGKPNIPGSSRVQIQFGRDGTAQVNVAFVNTGVIDIYRGSTYTGASGVFNANIPHWFAIEVIASNAGLVNVWVDGVLKATFAGDTQEHLTLSDWNHFGFSGNLSPNPYGVNAGDWYIDDIIVTDNTTGRVAEHYIPPFLPDADSAPLTLTPDTGLVHFSRVNEVPADDNTYNSTTVSGNEDLYGFANPPAAASYLALNFLARATRDGALTQGQISVKSGGITVYAGAVTLPASPAYLGHDFLLETDPNTGVAWVTAGVNAVQAGYKITT